MCWAPKCCEYFDTVCGFTQVRAMKTHLLQIPIANGPKTPNTRCFNCGRLEHLRKDCYRSVTKQNTSVEDDPVESLNLQEFVRDVGR